MWLENLCWPHISLVSILHKRVGCFTVAFWVTFVLQVFRTDLITAMKVHDSFQLSPEEYYVLADPWRQDWEKGVQVPVSPQSIPQPVTR